MRCESGVVCGFVCAEEQCGWEGAVSEDGVQCLSVSRTTFPCRSREWGDEGLTRCRVVENYYNDGEDALDMRKPLSRDKNRECVREDGESVRVSPEDVW